ncbi:excinuclease ABC subunit B [Candidatus Wirthbacteria bacterium CG2_30_54_11]|uniref:UvrABC system protein B n=1 Tax=Candidatus Wirthbacteria bacterium CG2_30_54_11 TaxID=1817892 RepID=A0A1J5IRJ0_9BACT|nr:MAG: excinuclease ABC subunit B [Candidatus Wirthbacteria bacterium CG2_30_54_11]
MSKGERPFELVSQFSPTGDQPQAIEKLSSGIAAGHKFQTLLGVTGSGKTFTMAKIIEQTQRPALILAHNKTLAAQLFAEFRDFFPHNRVEYFVSYYDYYQPEAYIPTTDTYIEKDATINEEIDRLRHSATMSILSRRDTIIVASVSCIYGLGSPEEYHKIVLHLEKGAKIERRAMLLRLNDMQYMRNDIDFSRGKYRVRGDVVDIYQPSGEIAVRIELFGEEIERIRTFDPLTGEALLDHESMDIYPATHFVAVGDRLQEAIVRIRTELAEQLDYLKKEGLDLEAQRLEQRTNFDIEMLEQTGYCNGVENYSRHFDGRPAGEPPFVLLDYFPKDFLMFIDESHMTLPQVGAMYMGDRSRKDNLIRYGFRMPSARDNRPLKFEEFLARVPQVVFVSATPAAFEYQHSQQIAEQLVRPTGLIDPEVEVRPVGNQVKDLLGEIRLRTDHGQRVLVTTLTKKMAEDLSDYLLDAGIKTNYLHSDVKTLDRIDILRDLRLGVYDVIVGINLLREGLDLPEVSLVAILDADKQGYLRSETALIQTIGRAARHVEGKVIMYGDRITTAMEAALRETNRRRGIQIAYNLEHHIIPLSINKVIRDGLVSGPRPGEEIPREMFPVEGIDRMNKEDALILIKQLEKKMQQAAQRLEFEEAAMMRDQIHQIRQKMDL